jgi:hypothetical protein
VRPGVIRRIVVVIAYTGAVSTMTKGVVELAFN